MQVRVALWRPFQAIRYADEDNNPATDPDPSWNSYLPTPSHPAYVSVFVTTRVALLDLIAGLEGDCGPVSFAAYASGPYPGGTKTFTSVAEISDACVDARVNVGLQYRDSAETSRWVGHAIAGSILTDSLPPVGRRHHERCGFSFAFRR